MRFPLIIKTLAALVLIPLQAQVSDGLPNCSTRLVSDSNGVVFSSDFLAWHASQEIASIYADVVTRFGVIPASWKAPGFAFDWNYGFRIGSGMNLAYDQWDLALYWTWYRAEASERIDYSSKQTIGAEFFAAFLTYNVENNTVFDIAQKMGISWRLLFNVIDCEVGRSYWLTNHLSMRPFIGLKGGWIHQAIDAKYENLSINSVPTSYLGREHLKNNFWGIGPAAGINTKWRARHFGAHFFNLFGDFSVATLWGNWSCLDQYQSSVPIASSVTARDSSLGALMGRGFMGIGWDVDFRQKRSHFAAKIGYEMQIWFNQLRIATFQLQRLRNDLTLQGVTLNCRMDY